MFAIFTDVPMAEARELIKQDIVLAKKRMAYEITKFIRGEQDAIEAQNMSENLFGGEQSLDNAPTVKLNVNTLDDKLFIVDLLTEIGFTKSKGEARRLIEQKGISKNNEIVSSVMDQVSKQDLQKGILFKKGKKNFILVIAE